jgi:hypothetical protein
VPRLGAIGTFVWDRIHPPEEPDGSRAEPVEDWGGLAYSLEGFSAARDSAWDCLPVAKVGTDLFEEVAGRVGGIGGIGSLDGLLRVPEANNRVDLFYHDTSDRCEHLQGGVPGWSWPELEPLVGTCDALYVNFIAGWEMDLDTAEAMRWNFDGPIYCDIHSLLLGATDTGMRVRRELPDWPRWSGCFDLIQGNADEIRIVSGIETPLEAVRTMAGGGPMAVFSTLGAGGVAWAVRGHDRAVESGVDRAAGEWSATDPTGCGDVWGAVCFASYLAGESIPSSASRANRLSAVAASRSGTAGLAAELSAAVVESGAP